MFRFLCGLIFGLVLGVAAGWWFATRPQPADLAQWKEELATSSEALRQAFQEKLELLHLTATNIQQELARRGRIVRRAAVDFGHTVADATTDARIVAAIKARYIADPRLSALRISVRCTSGQVFLSGTVDSAEDIGRAVLLAMEADPAVREVTADLKVSPPGR
ncbi:MAG: hypothetical protein KatS3mg132_376 [Limisphaera sp.]|nr:MAG: hypothetical protein KatS3mg132_376 [Limisphaera sp.]